MLQYIHLPVGKNVYKWDRIIHTIFYSLPCFLKSDGFIEAMGSEEAQLLKSSEVLNQSELSLINTRKLLTVLVEAKGQCYYAVIGGRGAPARSSQC